MSCCIAKMPNKPLVYMQLSIMPTHVAIILAFPTCSLLRECLHYFAKRCLCCVSARFAPDGCNQRLQWHPLPTLWAPAKHSGGGCHWTDVCWPAQLLVAGACHLTRPCFISTSVIQWKYNMPWLAGPGPGEHAVSLCCHHFDLTLRVITRVLPTGCLLFWQVKKRNETILYETHSESLFVSLGFE